MNEELQSTTEELETGKEELQSANEELLAVNQELQAKNDELARSNSDLANFITSSDIATVFLDERLHVRRYTPRALEIFNLIPGDVGRPFAHLTHNLEDADLAADAERVLRDLAPAQREITSTVGRTWLARARPYRTADNRIGGIVMTFVDITDIRRAEAALRASEVRFRALVTSTSEVTYRMNADWSEMRTLSGGGFLADTSEPTRTWFEDYIPRDDRPHVRTAIDAAIGARKPFELEHRVIRADGTVGWTSSRATPIFDERGRIIEWFGAAVDITVRKRAEEHEQLLIHELNHRVKNTLATVQALAMQTFRQGAGSHVAFDTFEARLQALSAAHDVLTREKWKGADIRDIVDRALAAWSRGAASRVELKGPALRLRPEAALALALALHELATNASKYGALSNAVGVVDIRWSTSGRGDAPAFRLEWQERDGPPVKAPARTGFGARLIEQGLAQDLGGSARLTFAEAGVECVVDAPLDEIREQGPLP